jgi:hypothetical protein
MNGKCESMDKAFIDIKDEKEFKLWLKFIASVYKNGGDIKKPVDILWKSLEEELTNLNSKNKIRRKREIAA